MCSIIGSPRQETFSHLIDENLERGNFAYGITMIDLQHTTTNFGKSMPQYTLKRIVEKSCYDPVFFLGHLQSPTSAKRDFSVETTHPFEYRSKLLAHNGVLENFEQLKADNPELPVNEVDSSIILPLIDKYGLKAALEKLQGTFGCWLYDTDQYELLVFRSGSTIYTDGINFGSKPLEGWWPLDEGIVYRFNFSKMQYERSISFRTSSGFFI